MTIDIKINTIVSKSEGISGVGLTGEAGQGLEFKPPYGMPGAYKYKVERKKEKENEIFNRESK